MKTNIKSLVKLGTPIHMTEPGTVIEAEIKDDGRAIHRTCASMHVLYPHEYEVVSS